MTRIDKSFRELKRILNKWENLKLIWMIEKIWKDLKRFEKIWKDLKNFLKRIETKKVGHESEFISVLSNNSAESLENQAQPML